jgi:hypothetical protein
MKRILVTIMLFAICCVGCRQKIDSQTPTAEQNQGLTHQDVPTRDDFFDQGGEIDETLNWGKSEDITSEIYMEFENDHFMFDAENLTVIQVKIVNNSDEEILTGLDYRIEQFKEDGWVELPTTYAWYDIGIPIKAGNENSYTIEQYITENGTYRISKSIRRDQIYYELSGEITVD